jgi:hypothetical protein
MKLTNLSTSARNDVFLSRYYDGDIDGTTSDLSAQSLDSVWANDASGHALSLTGLTFSTSHGAVRSKFANWDPNGPIASPKHGRFACRTFDNDPPTQNGDFVGWVTYSFGTINAGSSKTVKVVYRRY